MFQKASWGEIHSVGEFTGFQGLTPQSQKTDFSSTEISVSSSSVELYY